MATYELSVETDDTTEQTVLLRLRDEDGKHRGSHVVRLRDHTAAAWEGVFDTRAHVERYEGRRCGCGHSSGSATRWRTSS